MSLLMPCPFCGSRRHLVLLDDPQAGDWQVSCGACAVTMVATDGLQAVLDRWNRRAAPAPAGPEDRP
jgi:Lar family restriction alleviation protein